MGEFKSIWGGAPHNNPIDLTFSFAHLQPFISTFLPFHLHHGETFNEYFVYRLDLSRYVFFFIEIELLPSELDRFSPGVEVPGISFPLFSPAS